MAKLSTYPNATNAAAITLFGLQLGGDVQVPANALAKAIQDAIQVAVNFPFAGNVSAANLSGTNTGDQIAATVSYNNTSSHLSSTTVQGAIDLIATGGAPIVTSVRPAPQKVSVTPGTYGDATHVGQFKADKFGRICYAATIAIQSASSTQPGFISAADYNNVQSLTHAAFGGI